jgi:predicted O-methyltransferase YrrM
MGPDGTSIAQDGGATLVADAAPPATAQEFAERFAANLAACAWAPHPRFSVFTQYDQWFYLQHRPAFEHKYRSFHAVSRTVAPRKIIELGACAGSSADAYVSAAPGADYLGIDMFGPAIRQDNGAVWDPYEVARQLFEDRGFARWRLLRADLRSLAALPETADFVVVDAAHDYDNEYADLRLALTANPEFIFVDDAEDPQVARSIRAFLREDVRGRLDYSLPIQYAGGGFVIKLKPA